MDSYDLTIVGAGPGGYVAAIRAAQLGMQVALVEKNATLGGTCLNVGCIPSKALLESSHHHAMARSGLAEHGIGVGEVTLDLGAMMKRKEAVVAQLTGGVAGLMKKNGVTVIRGIARLLAAGRVRVAGENGDREVESRHVLLATGSEPVSLPGLPFDGDRVVSSTEALSFETVPGHLLVVGAGAVGLELGAVWSRLGARVSVVEMLPQIVPFADKLMARMLARSLKDQGLEIRTGTKVTSADVTDRGVTVSVEDAKGKTEQLGCDRVLVAVGRRPTIEGLGLEQAGVALDEHGRVAVGTDLQTSVGGIWAIGDLVAGPMLAHKAEEEGIAVTERMAGLPGHVSYATIPSVVYTRPELAQVGLTEEQAREQGMAFRVGKFYFRANGRALASGETDGLVKVLADRETDRLLGVHILGPQASELIAEAVSVMEFGGSAEDLARTVHAHPTLAEAVREAALAVDGRAIHA